MNLKIIKFFYVFLFIDASINPQLKNNRQLLSSNNLINSISEDILESPLKITKNQNNIKNNIKNNKLDKKTQTENETYKIYGELEDIKSILLNNNNIKKLQYSIFFINIITVVFSIIINYDKYPQNNINTIGILYVSGLNIINNFLIFSSTIKNNYYNIIFSFLLPLIFIHFNNPDAINQLAELQLPKINYQINFLISLIIGTYSYMSIKILSLKINKNYSQKLKKEEKILSKLIRENSNLQI